MTDEKTLTGKWLSLCCFKLASESKVELPAGASGIADNVATEELSMDDCTVVNSRESAVDVVRSYI